MKIIVSNTYEEMSKNAADFLMKRMAQEKRVNLGLATGNTPTGMYRQLVEYLNLGYGIEHVHFYNIDEYCDVDETVPGTCAYYLQVEFFGKTKISSDNIHLLTEHNYAGYDTVIEKNGGFDTVILGIGENGHIAYNEPNTPFDTLTNVLALTHESKVQHSEEFGGYDHVPNKAVTIGIKTIMNAQNILLMANGSKKAEIIKESLTGKITEDVPGSILQLHPRVVVLLDREAAGKLS
ncbi:glucosamine-6-phosphate deaminase [Bacillus sp. FJAT-49736]|uniref:glucosamine-6-phosphate deaminase n=1 Tax=Bacillus sp. FJAT-49736 TaxID=2833582 RepID=UPI0020165D3E|nr:glucosamine-6-phosphate deaminase [Bacillus sp. FJAT-49736]